MTIDLNQVNQLLHDWLWQYTSGEAMEWLIQKQTEIANGAASRVFFTAFSAVPRYIGKQSLQSSPKT